MLKPLEFLKKYVIRNPFKDISDAIKRKKELKTIKHIEYAICKMESVDCSKDLSYKIEAARWLLLYYSKDPNALSDGPPERKLRRLLMLPSANVKPEDHIFVCVLHHWIEYGRIEGY